MADRERYAKVLWAGGYLSFAAPGKSPLAGDRFFGLFHFGPQLLRVLHGMGPDQVVAVPRYEQLLRVLRGMGPDQVVVPPRELFPRLDGASNRFSLAIAVSHRIVNPPSWKPAPPVDRETFWQGIAAVSRGEGGLSYLHSQRHCHYVGEPLVFECGPARLEGRVGSVSLQRMLSTARFDGSAFLEVEYAHRIATQK
jgi:hypothetical protein